MKWYEVELEIPIYGKSFEIVKAPDIETAKEIAVRKTESQYNFPGVVISISRMKKFKI